MAQLVVKIMMCCNLFVGSLQFKKRIPATDERSEEVREGNMKTEADKGC